MSSVSFQSNDIPDVTSVGAEPASSESLPFFGTYRRHTSSKTHLQVCTALIVGMLATFECGAELQSNHEIIVSIAGGNNIASGLEAVARSYESLHPNIRIRIEVKGGGHGMGYSTWLNTELSTGNPRPDIVSSNYAFNFNRFVDFDLYRRIINPHTGREWHHDLDFNYYHFRNVSGIRSMLATQSVKVMWYYNLDLFERHSIKPPATWSELIATFEELRRLNYTPHTVKFNFRFHQWLAKILWDQFTRPYVQIVRAKLGDWCYHEESDDGWLYDPSDHLNDAHITLNYKRFLKAIEEKKIAYDGPEFKAVLIALKEIADSGASDFLVSTGTDLEESYNRFLRQESPIHLDTSGLITALNRDMAHMSRSGSSFRWGVFDTPSLESPYAQAPARSIESASGEYVGIIYKSQPQVDATIDFLMYWLSHVGYQIYIDELVTTNSYNPGGNVLIQDLRLPDSAHAVSRWMTRVGNAETAWNMPFQLPPEGSRLQRDTLLLLTRYIQGHITIDEAAQRIQQIMLLAVPVVANRFGFSTFDLEQPALAPRQR